MVEIKEAPFKKFDKCLTLQNGLIELVAPLEVGPRILHLGFVGGQNFFGEMSEGPLKEHREWQMYGGHRLWHSPEHPQRTYFPDNAPVQAEKMKNGFRLIQSPEAATGIQKTMEVVMDEMEAKVYVRHTLKNCGLWPVKLALWSLSVMAKGGLEIIPQSREDTGLLANRTLALWPYAHMDDKRVWWGRHYIGLRQDPAADSAFKIGLNNEAGWAAYFLNGQMMMVQFHPEKGHEYPDFGMSYETYTNGDMLELEVLSPLQVLDVGQQAELRETWRCFDHCKEPTLDPKTIEKTMAAYGVK